jgi:hypothetical protein
VKNDETAVERIVGLKDEWAWMGVGREDWGRR